MKPIRWGEIYCYLVLLITMCSMLVTTCFFISNVHDLYYPSNFDDSILKTKYDVALKNETFNWDASENKDLKEFANQIYQKRSSFRKELFHLHFFMIVFLLHVFALRRMRKSKD